MTHRILGPTSTATIILDAVGMKDGDRAGLAMLRDSSAWVGVARDKGKYRVVMRQNITLDRRWDTANTGEDVASAPVLRGSIWLRASADIRPGGGRTAVFSYSTDGRAFKLLGQPFVLNNRWQFFMGYRYGIFNYATLSLGGVVKVRSFTVTSP